MSQAHEQQRLLSAKPEFLRLGPCFAAEGGRRKFVMPTRGPGRARTLPVLLKRELPLHVAIRLSTPPVLASLALVFLRWGRRGGASVSITHACAPNLVPIPWSTYHHGAVSPCSAPKGLAGRRLSTLAGTRPQTRLAWRRLPRTDTTVTHPRHCMHASCGCSRGRCKW